MKEIVLSGIRATGQLHLGNYYGALSKFVRMQEEGTYDNFFFIANLHDLKVQDQDSPPLVDTIRRKIHNPYKSQPAHS